MSRFMLFAGERYYPAGGTDDLIGVYETEKEYLNEIELLKNIKNTLGHEVFDWFLVYDIENKVTHYRYDSSDCKYEREFYKNSYPHDKIRSSVICKYVKGDFKIYLYSENKED